MPKLIIIYDPTSRLETGGEITKALKLREASLSISDELTNGEIEDIVKELATLLLEQVRLG